MKGDELNWKIKTVLLVFAPCTQLTFLGAFIYFWMKEKSEKEVGIIYMFSFISFNKTETFINNN